MRAMIQCCLLFLLAVGLSGAANAANQYWDSSSAGGYQHANGTWSTNAVDTNWRAGHTSVAAGPWTNGNSAFFSATNGTSFITLSSAITAVGMTMSGGGHTLVITNGGTLGSSTGNPNISGSNNTFVVTGQGSQWNFNNTSPTFGNNTTATNNALTIDQGGGVENIGTLNVGKSSAVQLLGGTLSVSNVNWNTNGLFAVGDGTQAAMLVGRGGTLTFQDGVLVNSNAVLAGSGTLNGSTYGVVMTNGATLTVGVTNTITTLTLRDSAKFHGGSTLNLNITNVAGVAGTDWDQVRVLGSLGVVPNGGKLKIKLDSLGETAGGFDSSTSRIVPMITFASSSLSLADIEVDASKFLIGNGWTLEVTSTDIRYVYQRTAPVVYVSAGGDNSAGTNWSTAFTTLSNAWNTVQDYDTVYVAGQTFLTTQIVLRARHGVSILGGYEAASDAVLPGPNDPAQWPTILARDPGVAETRILHLSGLTNCVLKDLTIRDGFTITGGLGSGAYIASCEDLILDSCMIISNRLGYGVTKGAGVYVASGRVNIINSLIISNSIYASSGNPDARGGGLCLEGGTTTVTRCRIAGNTVRGNFANEAYGAGVYLSASAVGTIRQTVISGNSARRHPQYNTVTRGGGICNLGRLFLENCLIDHNWDERLDSDGIYSGGNLTLLNCTVADNGGADGYGISRAGGTVSMTNSIVWGHLDDIFGFPDNGGVPLIVSNVAYSCIQDGDNAGEQWCMDLDPLFVDTNYYHLQSTMSNYVNGYFSGGTWGTSLSNSPAIDACDPAIAPTAEPEPNGGKVNMGAYGNTEVASLSPEVNATLPAILNLGATASARRTATLNAEVTDTGGDTPDCWFEYWITGSSVTSTASAGLQSAVFPKVVSGLEPASAYQFRAVASNAGGVTYSTTNTFSTHLVPSSFYVGTNGNNTAGTNWSTAFTDPQTAFSASENGDTIYLAGHNFAKEPDINAVSVWTWSGVSNVAVIGGHQAVSDVVLPGPRDPAQWPTVLKRASGDARILLFSGLTNSTLRGVTIRDGLYTTAASGGGLYASGCSGLTLDTCVFTNNVVYGGPGQGGGLYAVTSSLLVTNCLFTRNTARGTTNAKGHGGGVYAASGVSMTMTDCQVITNTAQGIGNQNDSGYGGGFYFASGSTSVITRTVVSRNRAFSADVDGVDYGGGLFNNGGRVTLRNCLVVRNDSDEKGDGIYSGGALMDILNCTVADNAGVGIQAASGTVGMTNSIVWGNGDDLTGTLSVAYCDIQTADDFWTNGVNGCISADPLFVDNVYYHLQSKAGNYLGGYFSGGSGWGASLNTSPCIDTGYPDPAKPWRGVEPEPSGGRSNMGAYGNTTVASKGISAGTLFLLR